MTLGVFLPLRTWEVTLWSRGFFTQETTLSGPGGVPRAGLEFWRRHRRRLEGEGYISGSLLPAFAPEYRERGRGPLSQRDISSMARKDIECRACRHGIKEVEAKRRKEKDIDIGISLFL